MSHPWSILPSMGKHDGDCYWCNRQARFLVEWVDVPVEIKVCAWHAWPYQKGRSRACEVTELNGELTSV